MSSKEKLIVLALRVLPEKLRECLQTKRDRPEKEKEGADPSEVTREQPGSGDGKYPPGTRAFFMACGERARDAILERR